MLARFRLFALTLLTTAVVVLLVARRPPLAPSVTTRGSGDALAITVAWLVALGLSAWLAASGAVSLVVVAARRRRDRALAFAPAFVRRLVEVALVGSCLVGSAISASAASRDVPIVRAPASVPRPTSTTSTTTRPAPVPTTVSAAPTPMPAPTAASPAPPKQRPTVVEPRPPGPTYVVQPGDNLWNIARGDVSYWHALIERNQAHLRSGNPNLIFPGEILSLPDQAPKQ